MSHDQKVSEYNSAITALNTAKLNHEKMAVTPGKEAKVSAAQAELTKVSFFRISLVMCISYVVFRRRRMWKH